MLEKLLDIYSDDIPAFLYEIADSPQMQRLKGIGMHCGCEYTSFPVFQNLENYSRFIHSMGVGAIVWNFTHDPKQAIAGLLHDVASPSFAHVIDFMKGDYLRQESTEERTASIISSSREICEVLAMLSIPIEQVSDYHLYPVADNDTPRLSADRLEYTLSNILNYNYGTLEDVKRYYNNLFVDYNEEGEYELCFSDFETAKSFAFKALECSRLYVLDADRYSMQHLSSVVRGAVSRGILTEDLLYTTEQQVIEAITSDKAGKRDWEAFRRLNSVRRIEAEAEEKAAAGAAAAAADKAAGGAGVAGGEYPAYKIDAKRRYINPFVYGRGRLSEISEEFCSAMEEFKSRSFDYLLEGWSDSKLITE